MIRAARAVPGSDRDPNHDGSDTEHVKSLITFITEQYLLIQLARPALFAHDLAVVVALDHRVPGGLHDLRHRLVLPRGRRTAARRLSAAESRELRRRPGMRRAGRSHRMGTKWGYWELYEGELGMNEGLIVTTLTVLFLFLFLVAEKL